MIDLKLTADGDLEFDQDLTLTDEIEEVKQALLIILKSKRGSFFADRNMGLDQTMLIGKKYDLDYAASNIAEALKQDERVASVVVNDIKVIGRALQVNFIATLERDQTIEMEVALDD